MIIKTTLPLTILIIDNSIAFTGAFKCALNEAELLSDKHRFVFVLSNKSILAKTLADKGITVHTLPMLEIKRSVPVLLMYPFVLLKNALLLKSIVRKEQVDIVQVNDFYNMLGVMIKVIGYKGKLLTYVRFLPAVMPGPLRNIWIKLGLKYSHKMIGVSDAVLQQLPQHPKAIRIYDPVQLSETLPVKTYTDKDTVSLLYLSNYIQGKGQDDALEAFAKAYCVNNNMRITFAGGDMGMEKNKAYRQQLEQRAVTLGLGKVVSFEPFNADVEGAIKNADIVLNFSEAESFSMTCLEAAYYGTALIATRCGGPEEIIDNAKTGITVPVKDREAMKDAILLLAGNAVLRTQYAAAGKAYVRQKFNTANYIQAMEEITNTRNA